MKHANAGIYPYHMPGHKRNVHGQMPEEMYRLDITEIDGFDNLHMPQGLLLDLQKKAARLYGADESFYLVNGSTGGILSAVSTAVPENGHLLLSRNCHKSVYHAAYLRKLRLSYLYPKTCEGMDLLEAVTADEVEEALATLQDVDAVLIVSPTYEGRIADIGAIAKIVHDRSIPLIVDEAHGAHLGLSNRVHENSCRLGADLVIHSVHKTLPGLTQTALLHVCGERIDRALLKRFLRIYQTSSPSYLLMAGIDNALRYVEENGTKAYEDFTTGYHHMLQALSACRHLTFPAEDAQRQDIGKLVISVRNTDMTGQELYRLLLDKYRLQLEMAAESYCLAMFTIGDSREGFDRMQAALLEIDSTLHESTHTTEQKVTLMSQRTPAVLSLREAWEAQREEVPLEKSADRIAAEFVNLYPPGTPVLVPGERITVQMTEQIAGWLSQGLNVQGLSANNGRQMICVVRKES